jgi:hypothetical protein
MHNQIRLFHLNLTINDDTNDLASILFYARTIDNDKMPVNRSVLAPTLIDNEVQNGNKQYLIQVKAEIPVEVFS